VNASRAEAGSNTRPRVRDSDARPERARGQGVPRDVEGTARVPRDVAGTASLAIVVPEQLVQAIVERVLVVLDEREQARESAWPEWMSVETAAAYLDVSPERVRKLQARGQLPFFQEAPGCRVTFSRRELDETIRRWRAR
jgi:excisionase family DNA binding protein